MTQKPSSAESTTPPGQFFLIAGSAKVPELLRLAVSLELQGSLSALFETQRQALCDPERERIPFDGRYRPRADQLFQLQSYTAPKPVLEAISYPLGCRTANADDLEDAHIRGIMCAAMVAGRVDARFQVFSRGQVLKANRLNLFLSRDTFVRMEAPGLSIADRLTAHLDGDTLYFQSFAKTRQVLDLGDAYVEATGPELQGFFANPIFDTSQLGALRDTTDQQVRQKVASLLKNKVFERLVPTQLADVAARVGLKVQLIRDRESPERVQLPGTKKQLKQFLRVLDEDYLQSLFDETRVFETSSKRPVE